MITIAPVSKLGPWSEIGTDESDLLDRERFLCLSCDGPYRPNRMEQIYQGWRYQHRRIILKLNRTFATALAEPPPL